MASNYQLPLAGLLLVAQIILCLVLIQAQNTNFSFSSFNSTDSFLAVGDSRYDSFTSSYLMNELGYDNFKRTCGRLLYGEKVRMKDPVSGAVASFNTTFTFQITADPDHYQIPGNGDGLAFTFFRSINFTDETTGGALCLLNDTDNGMPSNRLFAVEFDTFLNPVYNDPSNNHIGVNVNSMNSTPPIFSMCETVGINCTYLCNGGKFTSWIDYDSASQEIQVFFVNSSLYNNNKNISKPPTPVIKTILGAAVVVPLVDLLDEYMYVGFSASTGAYAEVNHIQSWTFLSSMPEQPPSPAPNVMPEQPPSRAPNVLTNSSSSHKRKVGIIVGICAGAVGAVVVLLVLGFFIVRYRRRLQATLPYCIELVP
jgi:hypothetical protein